MDRSDLRTVNSPQTFAEVVLTAPQARHFSSWDVYDTHALVRWRGPGGCLVQVAVDWSEGNVVIDSLTAGPARNAVSSVVAAWDSTVNVPDAVLSKAWPGMACNDNAVHWQGTSIGLVFLHDEINRALRVVYDACIRKPEPFPENGSIAYLSRKSRAMKITINGLISRPVV